MSKSLKALFVPFMSDTGHVNACIGLAQKLINNGHKAVFVVKANWKEPLEKYGIEVCIVESTNYQNKRRNSPHVDNSENMSVSESLRNKSARTNMRDQYYMELDDKLRTVLKEVSPDLIVWEQWNSIPLLETSGIPWVWLYSSAPLYMYGVDEDVPPAGTGLPSYEDRHKWKEYLDVKKELFYDQWKQYNDFTISRGAPPLKEHCFTNGSPFLNVYGFPKELDYSDLKPLPKHYVRFDNLMRTRETQEDFNIPEQLKDKPGKLIYVSLGTVNKDGQLLKRLIDIMAQLKHRFIVSKGPLGDSYELPSNMWGQQSLPQIQILPVVDLVITHGGNNTVCETFYFGKPMIVMPVSDNDQVDNAQRIDEKGFGIRLNPRTCTKEQVSDAIEKLLADKDLNERLINISKRIQTDNEIEEFSQLVEGLFP